ncbi:antitoxin ChpS [mine drainage metagenome]|uniref:Antitoxin ChpS n=1 Tax=mine drainage metagenome TaxID=410659 RepID=A0A1J5RJT1_9ZZZZ
MRIALRKIGNSRGVLIPAALLAACDIKEEVEMRVEHNRLIIESVTPQLRKGWFDGYQAEGDVDAWAELKETPVEQEEWEW